LFQPMGFIHSSCQKGWQSQVGNRFEGAEQGNLDAAGAYHAVTKKVECRDYTAFVSPFGTFRFIRMPLRLSNAGFVYSQMKHLALSRVDPDNWMGYLDDVSGFASEPWEHLKNIKPLVEAHLKACIKIQPCKTKLWLKHI